MQQRWPGRCLPGLHVGAASISGPERALPFGPGVTDPAAAFGAGCFGQKSNSTVVQDLCIVPGPAGTASLAAAQWRFLC